MKKSILKSSIALAVAGVFGATIAASAAETVTEQAQPIPVSQTVNGPASEQDANGPVTAQPAVPAIQSSGQAAVPGETRVVRAKQAPSVAASTNTDAKATDKKADKADKDTKVKSEKKPKQEKVEKPSKEDKVKAAGKQVSDTARNGEQPKTGVVDQNSAAVVGANYILDAYTNKYGESKIASVSYKVDNGQASYHVTGFNNQGAHDLTLNVADGAVTEGPAKPYDASLEATAIDPGTVLPPQSAINAAYDQAPDKAVGLNGWELSNQNGKALYTVQFYNADNKPFTVVLDATTGKAVQGTAQ